MLSMKPMQKTQGKNPKSLTKRLYTIPETAFCLGRTKVRVTKEAGQL
jgi:hypothetical protein